MLAIEPDHDYAVLELGASRPGEIAALAELCRPKVGVITHVGDAHLGGFGSRQAIAEAKAELLAALPPDGQAVLGDDPWLRQRGPRLQRRVTWVGTDDDCDLVATDVQSSHGQLRFRVQRLPVLRARLGTPPSDRRLGRGGRGPHDGPRPGTRSPTSWKASSPCHALRSARSPRRDDHQRYLQLEPHGDAGGAWNCCASSTPPGRRIVVCGDMAELGDESAALHWQLGKQIVTLGGADLLIACGEYRPARGRPAPGRPACRRPGRSPADTSKRPCRYLGQAILPGDVVLVKGSRMMAMERVVAGAGRVSAPAKCMSVHNPQRSASTNQCVDSAVCVGFAGTPTLPSLLG